MLVFSSVILVEDIFLFAAAALSWPAVMLLAATVASTFCLPSASKLVCNVFKAVRAAPPVSLFAASWVSSGKSVRAKPAFALSTTVPVPCASLSADSGAPVLSLTVWNFAIALSTTLLVNCGALVVSTLASFAALATPLTVAPTPKTGSTPVVPTYSILLSITLFDNPVISGESSATREAELADRLANWPPSPITLEVVFWIAEIRVASVVELIAGKAPLIMLAATRFRSAEPVKLSAASWLFAANTIASASAALSPAATNAVFRFAAAVSPIVAATTMKLEVKSAANLFPAVSAMEVVSFKL